MSTIQQASIFNVKATLNTQMATDLAAVTRPAWLPTLPTIYYTWPETEITPPAFSFTHIDVGAVDSWERRGVGGGLKGLAQEAIMDVGCWVTRKRNRNWNAQLDTMRDMVMTVVTSTTEMVILDYEANQSTPATTSFLVRLGDSVARGTVPDSNNPDIERVRILIDYRWIFRSA